MLLPPPCVDTNGDGRLDPMELESLFYREVRAKTAISCGEEGVISSCMCTREGGGGGGQYPRVWEGGGVRSGSLTILSLCFLTPSYYQEFKINPSDTNCEIVPFHFTT